MWFVFGWQLSQITLVYKIFSHTADIGLALRAADLNNLFREAAIGWKHLVLENSLTRGKETRRIRLTADDPEDLLVQWLSELNYFLMVEQWVFHEVAELNVETSPKWRLTTAITGERFDPAHHYIYFEIKAATYHQLHIRKHGRAYETRIVFDI